MNSQQKRQYPKKMLPAVNYDELENSSLLSINIVDLEYGIINHLSVLTNRYYEGFTINEK
jgi:hypothetical protein